MTNIFLPGCGARPNSLLAATFVAALLWAPVASAAVLENPGEGSYRSGVALVSGWACDATDVEVELIGADSTEVVPMIYGSDRGDTPCDDSANGFGAVTNLNRLGTGPATAKLRVDGEVVAENAFTITVPTDENFNSDLSGAYTLPGFPGDGQAVDLVWKTAQQGWSMAPAGSSPATAAAVPSSACPTGFKTACNLGIPGPHAFESGVLLISGWACEVLSNIRLVLKGPDATENVPLPWGSARGDTLGICGDTANGFGALWLLNRLGNGQITAELWIDDELALTYEFWNTKPSDQNFNDTASGEFRLPDFPEPGKDTIVIWQKDDQGFSTKEIIEVSAGPTPTPAPGDVPTPGITPTPSPAPTQTPDGGGPTPTPDPGGPTPTPTPGGGPLCGNGVLDEGEQCDGDEYIAESCEEAFADFAFDECLEGSQLGCTEDCRIDGTLCICPCEEDFDCTIPEGELIDCGPSYCTTEFCPAEDVEFCECAIGFDGDIDGACPGANLDTGATGFCITTPFDPDGNPSLDEVCQGLDGGDPETPRCDYCFE